MYLYIIASMNFGIGNLTVLECRHVVTLPIVHNGSGLGTVCK